MIFFFITYIDSTMSTGLNSMTGVIYEDMIKVFYKKELSEAEASNVMKVIVVLLGLLCVILVFVIEQLGTLIEVSKVSCTELS